MRCSRASCPSAWRSASLPRCGDLSTERPVDCRRTRTGEYRWCAPPASPPTTTALLHRPPTPPSYAPRAEAEGGRTCLPQWARVRRVAASGCWLTACWLTACCLSVPARAGCYVPQQAGGCGRPSLQAGGEADLEAVLVPAGAATTERQPARTVASSRTGRRTRPRRTILQDRRSRQDRRCLPRTLQALIALVRSSRPDGFPQERAGHPVLGNAHS